MTEPKPFGPILRRTWGPESFRLRVLTPEEERRRGCRCTRYAKATDLDRRLARLGYAGSTRREWFK
jgi:hypothetical protein